MGGGSKAIKKIFKKSTEAAKNPLKKESLSFSLAQGATGSLSTSLQGEDFGTGKGLGNDNNEDGFWTDPAGVIWKRKKNDEGKPTSGIQGVNKAKDEAARVADEKKRRRMAAAEAGGRSSKTTTLGSPNVKRQTLG
jgi:hypothetical protein